MVAGNKENLIKIVIQMFQGTQTVVQSHDIDAGTIVVPVAQEHGNITPFLLGFGSEPSDKIQTIFIMGLTVAF